MTTLATRRRRVLGINRVDRIAFSRRNITVERRARLTKGTGNSAVQVLSKVLGTAGNSTTLTLVAAGASTPLSVSVTGTAITVNLATNGASAAISTALQVVNAINASLTASALVWAQIPAGSDGTGVVAAATVTALAGGRQGD